MPPTKPWTERTPLESFDPRYRQVWLEGALARLELTLASPGEASQFLLRMQMYRKRYAEKHGKEAAAPLYRAKASRSGATITVYPGDSNFASILAQFPLTGVDDILDNRSPADRSSDSQTPIPAGSQAAPDEGITLDELFSSLKGFDRPQQ